MATIEHYRLEPRTCQGATLAAAATKCKAEVILTDEYGKQHFLCKHHAAQSLSGNRDLLAKAVVELALR